MVTKIKPYRIRDVNEPEEGNSLQYNDPNTFARGEGGGGGGGSSSWGHITGTLSNQTDLQDALDEKQDTLIAGDNIQIASDGKTISAIGGIDVDVQNKTLYILEDGGGGGGGGGDVVGPSSAVNGHIAVFNGTTGKVIMDGGAIPTLTFANIAGQPTDNTNLANALSNKQDVSNLVTSVSSSSTDSQYPSAKLFYDTCGDIETLINAL